MESGPYEGLACRAAKRERPRAETVLKRNPEPLTILVFLRARARRNWASPPSSGRFGNSVAQSVVNDVRDRMEAKLKHDLRAMGLDGPDGYSELCGNLLIRLSLGQEANDFNLSGSRPGGTLSRPSLIVERRIQKSLEDQIGNSRGEETVACGDRLHSFHKRFGKIRLEEVSGGSRIKRSANQAARFVHREYQNFRSRNGFADSPRDFDAVKFRHPDVDDRNVRLQFDGLLYSLRAVGGFADDRPRALRAEGHTSPAADQAMIVG
jgi:hypothetical protein